VNDYLGLTAKLLFGSFAKVLLTEKLLFSSRVNVNAYHWWTNAPEMCSCETSFSLCTLPPSSLLADFSSSSIFTVHMFVCPHDYRR